MDLSANDVSPSLNLQNFHHIRSLCEDPSTKRYDMIYMEQSKFKPVSTESYNEVIQMFWNSLSSCQIWKSTTNKLIIFSDQQKHDAEAPIWCQQVNRFFAFKLMQKKLILPRPIPSQPSLPFISNWHQNTQYHINPITNTISICTHQISQVGHFFWWTSLRLCQTVTCHKNHPIQSDQKNNVFLGEEDDH